MSAVDLRDNRLLGGLETKAYARLEPLLEVVEVEPRMQVYRPRQPIEFVYFPLRAVFSLVAGVGEQEVEVSTIGREGMVGLPVFLGARLSPNHAFCQIPGAAARLAASDLVEFLGSADGNLHDRLHSYTQATIVQLAQSVACNQLHGAEQRAARWLMMSCDRVGLETFPLTHEFMAQMLGVRRATVSVVAGRLQRRGLITYTRGVVTITDRDGLEEVACACYRLVRDEFDRLL